MEFETEKKTKATKQQAPVVTVQKQQQTIKQEQKEEYIPIRAFIPPVSQSSQTYMRDIYKKGKLITVKRPIQKLPSKTNFTVNIPKTIKKPIGTSQQEKTKRDAKTFQRNLDVQTIKEERLKRIQNIITQPKETRQLQKSTKSKTTQEEFELYLSQLESSSVSGRVFDRNVENVINTSENILQDIRQDIADWEKKQQDANNPVIKKIAQYHLEELRQVENKVSNVSRVDAIQEHLREYNRNRTVFLENQKKLTNIRRDLSNKLLSQNQKSYIQKQNDFIKIGNKRQNLYLQELQNLQQQVNSLELEQIEIQKKIDLSLNEIDQDSESILKMKEIRKREMEELNSKMINYLEMEQITSLDSQQQLEFELWKTFYQEKKANDVSIADLLYFEELASKMENTIKNNVLNANLLGQDYVQKIKDLEQERDQLKNTFDQRLLESKQNLLAEIANTDTEKQLQEQLNLISNLTIQDLENNSQKLQDAKKQFANLQQIITYFEKKQENIDISTQVSSVKDIIESIVFQNDKLNNFNLQQFENLDKSLSEPLTNLIQSLQQKNNTITDLSNNQTLDFKQKNDLIEQLKKESMESKSLIEQYKNKIEQYESQVGNLNQQVEAFSKTDETVEIFMKQLEEKQLLIDQQVFDLKQKQDIIQQKESHISSLEKNLKQTQQKVEEYKIKNEELENDLTQQKVQKQDIERKLQNIQTDLSKKTVELQQVQNTYNQLLTTNTKLSQEKQQTRQMTQSQTEELQLEIESLTKQLQENAKQLLQQNQLVEQKSFEIQNLKQQLDNFTKEKNNKDEQIKVLQESLALSSEKVQQQNEMITTLENQIKFEINGESFQYTIEQIKDLIQENKNSKQRTIDVEKQAELKIQNILKEKTELKNQYQALLNKQTLEYNQKIEKINQENLERIKDLENQVDRLKKELQIKTENLQVANVQIVNLQSELEQEKERSKLEKEQLQQEFELEKQQLNKIYNQKINEKVKIIQDWKTQFTTLESNYKIVENKLETTSKQLLTIKQTLQNTQEQLQITTQNKELLKTDIKTQNAVEYIFNKDNSYIVKSTGQVSEQSKTNIKNNLLSIQQNSKYFEKRGEFYYMNNQYKDDVLRDVFFNVSDSVMTHMDFLKEKKVQDFNGLNPSSDYDRFILKAYIFNKVKNNIFFARKDMDKMFDANRVGETILNDLLKFDFKKDILKNQQMINIVENLSKQSPNFAEAVEKEIKGIKIEEKQQEEPKSGGFLSSMFGYSTESEKTVDYSYLNMFTKDLIYQPLVKNGTQGVDILNELNDPIVYQNFMKEIKKPSRNKRTEQLKNQIIKDVDLFVRGNQSIRDQIAKNLFEFMTLSNA